MLRNFTINFLFHLLGYKKIQLHSLAQLFGRNDTLHKNRERRWEIALNRLWLDKDMLDFLYYHAESDKEIVFKGKTNTDLSKGARLRTLFIVFSAHMAYRVSLQNKKGISASEKKHREDETKKVGRNFKKLVDIG